MCNCISCNIILEDNLGSLWWWHTYCDFIQDLVIITVVFITYNFNYTTFVEKLNWPMTANTLYKNYNWWDDWWIEWLKKWYKEQILERQMIFMWFSTSLITYVDQPVLSSACWTPFLLLTMMSQLLLCLLQSFARLLYLSTARRAGPTDDLFDIR